MDVAHPYKAVCPSLDGEVLSVLAGTTRGLTGREVALLTGRTSHSGVLAVLHRLADHGLVDRVELNRASLFSLNRDHLACPAVIELVGIRQELLDRIRKDVETWRVRPVHVSLFGSTARGDGDTASDIDLLVVLSAETDREDPCWREQIGALEGRISRWTGNHTAVVEISEDDVERLVTANRPVVAALRSDAITLTGPAVSTLLGDS